MYGRSQIHVSTTVGAKTRRSDYLNRQEEQNVPANTDPRRLLSITVSNLSWVMFRPTENKRGEERPLGTVVGMLVCPWGQPKQLRLRV